MNQTLEHLKNPNKCFEKFYKILNKGGMLFIETPTSDFYLKNKINKSIWGGYMRQDICTFTILKI